MNEQALRELLDVGVGGSRSCSHVPEDNLKIVEVGTPVWGQREDGWGPEHSLVVLVKVASETYPDAHAVLHESEDGPGCQCNGEVSFHKTLEEAVRFGLDTFERHSYEHRADAAIDKAEGKS